MMQRTERQVIQMPCPSDLCERFSESARKMYFSKASIDYFITHATPGQMRSVCDLLDCEMVVRKENKRKRLMRRAAFPVIKSLDAFDFTEVMFPEGYKAEDIMSLDFVKAAQDFVFYGKTGRGKTHLAIALGIACVNAGYEVLFFSTAALVRKLTQAHEQDTLEKILRDIERADVVILDEFGYIPIDINGARLLFQVISQSYERRSLVLTTNIEFSRWSTVFGDEKLAAAAVDRIVHHGRLIEFNGPSRRMNESLMLGKGDK